MNCKRPKEIRDFLHPIIELATHSFTRFSRRARAHWTRYLSAGDLIPYAATTAYVLVADQKNHRCSQFRKNPIDKGFSTYL